jgi:uncharacterized membrane protein YfcA
VEIDPVQGALDVAAGSLVGFSLGLVGGGGSILAVPLLIYFVGIADPHIAIGTSAVAVAASAAINLANHARSGRVKWPCALTFAAAGAVGAALGSIAGKATDGQALLALFAMLMIVIGVVMLWRRTVAGNEAVRLYRGNIFKVISLGSVSGALAGFFGIGGGFVIVPGLMLATGMPMINAVASSLVAVTAFGLTTTASYAVSGLVDWPLAALFVAGGVIGGLPGAALAGRMAARRGALNVVFATCIFAIAAYMLIKSPALA